MINKHIYEILKNYIDRDKYWDSLIGRAKKWGDRYSLNLVIAYKKRNKEMKPLYDWIIENTTIYHFSGIFGMDEIKSNVKKSINEYESWKIKRKKRKKRKKRNTLNQISKISISEQLNNANKEAEKMMEKWLKEPQSKNWWVQRYIESERNMTNKVKVSNDEKYKIYFSQKLPVYIKEVAENKFTFNHEYYNDYKTIQ